MISELKHRGFDVRILSGDSAAATAFVARQLEISKFSGDVLPAEKVEAIAAIKAQGCKVLMVGDGLNDAPAFAAGHASMAPATASDIGKRAADFVFLGHGLSAVLQAIDVSTRADRLVRENFAIAIACNAVSIPVAVLGLATPLIAAIAMSLSSVTVVANALRLRVFVDGQTHELGTSLVKSAAVGSR
ncbi:P-type E1-E2 ATPase [Neorhizobium sp. R1-B]|nr:P-type E1-E2 ATPase [Neorhizobium sp. R1-B]